MIRVLCIGDSNTYGMDPRGEIGPRYTEDVRWTCLLEAQDCEVINCGVNGATVPRAQELPATLALVQDNQPIDAVILMLGTNDLLLGITADVCAERMGALIRGIVDQSPEAKILLICPPATPLGSDWHRQELIDETKRLAEAYRRLAESLDVTFADAGTWEIDLAFDGVHFSESGHAVFAENVKQMLQEMTQK